MPQSNSVTTASCATNVSLYRNLPYDPVRDFEPVTLVATQNLMLLVHPSVAAATVKDLIGLAKSSPGKYSFASAGNGTGGHLSGELFKLLAGIESYMERHGLARISDLVGTLNTGRMAEPSGA